METSKINRVEVINHTEAMKDRNEGYGRAYVYWDTKSKSNIELSLQDDGRTLKIFISDKQ